MLKKYCREVILLLLLVVVSFSFVFISLKTMLFRMAIDNDKNSVVTILRSPAQKMAFVKPESNTLIIYSHPLISSDKNDFSVEIEIKDAKGDDVLLADKASFDVKYRFISIEKYKLKNTTALPIKISYNEYYGKSTSSVADFSQTIFFAR